MQVVIVSTPAEVGAGVVSTAPAPPVPPAASIGAAASSVRFACCSASNSASSSRPGVRMFHFLIANRNNR